MDVLNWSSGYLHTSDAFEMVLTAGLCAWVQQSDRCSERREAESVFHAKRAPPISLQNYVSRVVKYSSCSPACFSVAFAYILRLARSYECMVPSSQNVHRIVLATVMLAVKMNEDIHYDNAYFARIGGLPLVELNRLETDLLLRLQFDVCVDIGEMVEAEAVLIGKARAVAAPTEQDFLYCKPSARRAPRKMEEKVRPRSLDAEPSQSALEHAEKFQVVVS
mmetsp:Transcript_25152/g.99197  ORF Transcript_25152/g.99197 Transcript_25152/m.99197 type:complete len:221 (-) Transcript_25152:1993-2655(-)